MIGTKFAFDDKTEMIIPLLEIFQVISAGLLLCLGVPSCESDSVRRGSVRRLARNPGVLAISRKTIKSNLIRGNIVQTI